MSGKFTEKATPLHKSLTVIGLVLCLVFGFTLVCNLVIIVKGSLYPEMPPSVFGVTPMVTLSGSMSGTIEVGDLIFVDKAEPEELEAGDIIAFMSGKSVVTHRILEVQTAEDGAIQWLTKGDANNAEDQDLVHQDKLVGIYRSRIPGVGDFILFMKEPLGMVIFIGIPVMGFLIYDIFRRQQAAQREKQRQELIRRKLERLEQIEQDRLQGQK